MRITVERELDGQIAKVEHERIFLACVVPRPPPPPCCARPAWARHLP